MSATKYIKAHYEARKTQPPQKDEEEKAKQLLTNLFRSVVDSKRRNHGVEHFHAGSEEVKQGDDVVDYRDMEVTKEELIDEFKSRIDLSSEFRQHALDLIDKLATEARIPSELKKARHDLAVLSAKQLSEAIAGARRSIERFKNSQVRADDSVSVMAGRATRR